MKTLGIYISILLATLVFLIVIKNFDIAYPLLITTTNKSTELSVVGEGKVDVVPDSSTIDAGISISNANSVETARQEIDSVNNKIIDGVKALGIAKEDIKSTNYSITPAFSYDGGKNTQNGYNGNATVSVKVKNISILSKVIEEVTKAGANQIYATRFNIENPEKYREEARNLAIENAKTQAKKMADQLGIKLGRVVNIAESAPGQIYPVAMGLGASSKAEGANIEPGTQTISSTVTLYFEKN